MKIVKQLFDEHIRDEVLHPYDEYVSRITSEPPFFLGLVLWAYITGFPLVGCCDTLITKPVLSLILFSVTLLLLAVGFGFSLAFCVYCNKHYKDQRIRMLASNCHLQRESRLSISSFQNAKAGEGRQRTFRCHWRQNQRLHCLPLDFPYSSLPCPIQVGRIQPLEVHHHRYSYLRLLRSYEILLWELVPRAERQGR